jgi:glutathione S-transferase
MASVEATLYVDSQYLSPYAMSAFVALTEKGIPFKVEKVDLEARDQLREPFRSRSLTCRVPTLEHRGVHFSESSAIAEYLEEVFPPPKYPALYPLDPVARARARQVQAWLRSDLMPIREERPTEVVFLAPISTKLSDKARAAAQKLFGLANSLLKDEEGSIAGTWCLADTDLALMLNRLVLNGDDVPKNLERYAKRQWERASVQRWVKQQRKTK